MAYSYVERVGDGSNTSFTFQFTGADDAYLREDDIKVTVDGVEKSFSLTSSNTLELRTAPPNGASVLVRRVMPKDKTYADFSTGNNFGQEVLNNSFLQLLYVVHELLDGWFPEGFTVRQAVSFLEDVIIEGNLNVKGSLSVNKSDPHNPVSVVNYEEGDKRYVNKDGDTMEGPLHVLAPVDSDEPVQKAQLDQERQDRMSQDAEIESGYQAGDANLQDQLTGNVPLESSAFSPISWHGQTIDNSVVIPDNVNAWSFGPVVTINPGQTVTIGSGSYWTVADGEVQS